MATITQDLNSQQIQFKVTTPTGVDDGCDLVNNETGKTILEEGKSYSQTVTMYYQASKDEMKAFMEAVLSLCAGVREQADGVDLQGYPVVTKKIISQYYLISE